ncbi:hypothetical protein WGA_03952 [Escherichia coli KTE40]|nr:hypothetical protein WGA_03952 [Escherichia coli KTE40]
MQGPGRTPVGGQRDEKVEQYNKGLDFLEDYKRVDTYGALTIAWSTPSEERDGWNPVTCS